jgi:hypothetical protein
MAERKAKFQCWHLQLKSFNAGCDQNLHQQALAQAYQHAGCKVRAACWLQSQSG